MDKKIRKMMGNLEIQLENSRKMAISKVRKLHVQITERKNSEEIRARIVKGDICAGVLSKIIKSKSVSRNKYIQDSDKTDCSIRG